MSAVFSGDDGLNLHTLYERAMKLTDQAEADRYFDSLITYRMENTPCRSREEAAAIERENLAYYAGYHDHATRRRVEKLFACEHPFFGSIEENGPPTPEEAFAVGKAVGGGHWEAFKTGFAMGKRMALGKKKSAP